MLLLTEARFVARILALVLASAVCAAAQSQPAAVPVAVYKTATCGCCAKWNDHLRANGFAVTSTDLDFATLQSTKEKHGVPGQLRSCHTAFVGGYVVEGHVPADVIRKLLQERPKVTGITVPGMPLGSPGMEVEGSRAQAYDVLTFDASGATTVFASR